MRKTLSATPLALCFLGALVLYGCSANGGAGLTASLPEGQFPTPPAASTQHANGVVEDWSTSHVIYPRVGNVNAMMALQHDVRAIQSWQIAARDASVPRRFLPIQSDVHRDWSISLGSGSVAPAMYPAKFGFDVNATPNCTNDVAIFTVNTTTSATQPNIVGFNNLYSGTAGGTGICNAPANGRTAGPSDTGVAATVDWSYNVVAADGQVSTSPALSLDGTEVAFVETGSGGTAHFHVLSPSPGDGVNASNLQDATSQTVSIPAQTPFVTTLIEGTGNATDLALNIGATQSDTLSSPFIDYAHNLAYVGNDSGELFRIQNVFCIASANVCQFGQTPGTGAPAPSLDTSWGSGTGAISVCSGKLSGPVVDGSTGNIFVGCSDGKLYGFNSAGAALATASVTVGNGSATGGVVDPPLVDAGNQFVYAVAGASTGGTETVVQAKSTNLSGLVTGTLGVGGSFNMHAPSVNNAYLSGGPTAAGALLYDWGLASVGAPITLYAFGFNGSGVMGATPAHSLGFTGASSVELSPVTEFKNAGNDLLFVGGLVNAAPNFIEYNINSFPTAVPPSGGAGATGATAAEGSGTSGIIIDNASGSAQASSIYFGEYAATTAPNGSPTPVPNAAVKLTQGGLN